MLTNHFFFTGDRCGPKNDHFKSFALAFESMAPAGAIDSNETESDIPKISRKIFHVKYFT